MIFWTKCVSDDGIGFRYHLPESAAETVTIERELTTFKFPSKTRKGATPMAEVNTGWAETNPSYEEHYVAPVYVGTPSPIGVGWSYPALFIVDETWP
ncbi:MAG: glycoside hydrolase family 97 N-terminal domain-containing protein [Opitutales bacterium]|nr:glycoside hydrolase family 97 N-terminal domain-containing protein [Opitutales bacterium]